MENVLFEASFWREEINATVEDCSYEVRMYIIHGYIVSNVAYRYYNYSIRSTRT